jgi:manganese transport system substrate-binding protein
VKTYLKLILAGAVVIFLGYVALSVIQLRATKTDSDKPQVLTTFTVLEDMAKNVAGEYADVRSLTRPGTEIHGYEPTPGDIARMQGADLILDNGMGLEKWADKLYQNVPDVPHVTLTAAIKPSPIAEGPYKDKPNPHAWMSPANALKYVDAIAAALSDIDPAHATGYEKNASAYKKEIEAVDTKLRDGLKAVPADKRYLVTCEGAFSYLVKDYGLKELYLWPINADAQGTPQQIRKVVEDVRANNVMAVFCESTVSGKAQQQVAKETGATFSGVFYVDSLSAVDGPTPSYLKLLQYNVDTFLKGVKAN